MRNFMSLKKTALLAAIVTLLTMAITAPKANAQTFNNNTSCALDVKVYYDINCNPTPPTTITQTIGSGGSHSFGYPGCPVVRWEVVGPAGSWSCNAPYAGCGTSVTLCSSSCSFCEGVIVGSGSGEAH